MTYSETLRGSLGWTVLVSVLAASMAPLACASSDDDTPADADDSADSGGAPGDDDGDGTGDLPDYSGLARGRARAGGAFVHLFEWRWPDVARECEEFLGPHGFAAVQISPSNAHAVLPNQPWYERYQPAGYELESRSGTRAEFIDMVQRCDAAGVDIYVDAVINHMTAQASGTNSAGNAYTKYEYEGLYTEADFHVPACGIAGSDYANDADAVRNCELVGLSDLRTESDSVRQKITDYLVSYVELGVRGFRIDAAKHMNPADLQDIVARVSEAVGAEKAPYYFLEVIDNGNEAISAEEYLDVAGTSGSTVDITDFRYQNEVSQAFYYAASSPMLFTLENLSEGDFLPSDRAVVFTNNHDTQRNDTVAFYQSGAFADLANVFLLGWPQGYPQLMSSYAFSRQLTGQGPPSGANNATLAVYPDGAEQPNCLAHGDLTTPIGWICEHRHPAIAEMVGFRIDIAEEPVANLWTNGGNQLAFGRGSRGFVVLNGEGGPLSAELATGLPAGSYCDRLTGGRNGDSCRGSQVEVGADGLAQLDVPAQSALVIDERGRLP
ncbi:MAG TPA: alpha-amylase family protein [Polyangiaceae bacterium]|nr:alpha-amylase family protein [Polyangiaceae bacterium]